MSLVCENPAQRRYNLRIGIAMGLYVVLLACEHRFMDGVADPVMRYLIAALPALPVMACFVIMGRYLAEEQDEYIRVRTAIQSLWATGLTLAAATLWGFLEDAGAPHLPLYFVAIGWFASLGIVAIVQAIQQKVGGR